MAANKVSHCEQTVLRKVLCLAVKGVLLLHEPSPIAALSDIGYAWMISPYAWEVPL